MDVVLYQQGSKGIVVPSKNKPPSIAKAELAVKTKAASPTLAQDMTAKVYAMDVDMGSVQKNAPVVAAQLMDRTSAAGADDRMPSTTTDFDPGLTANVIGLSETPSMYLARVLGEGEEVLATFDVKFPGDFIPVWKIVMLCIATFGLYLIVLFHRWVRRCCYRWRCCVPALVSFSFGKMAITNKGRVICWEENIHQFKPPQKEYKGSAYCCYIDKLILRILCFPVKLCVNLCCRDLCAPPVTYTTVNFSRIYRTPDIRQITQYFVSEAACLYCCLDYSCGIEVSFNSFNHGTNHLVIASRSVFSDDHYGEKADAAVSSSSLGSYW